MKKSQNCEVCGRPFELGSKNHRFCSPACRLAFFRSKKSGKPVKVPGERSRAATQAAMRAEFLARRDREAADAAPVPESVSYVRGYKIVNRGNCYGGGCAARVNHNA